MNPFGNEDDTKKTVLQPEPLCLFCSPEEDSSSVFFGRQSYVNPLPKREPDCRLTGRRPWKRDNRGVDETKCTQKIESIASVSKERDEFWMRKRTEARIRRRRMKEPIRNLKTYLISSVKNEYVPRKTVLPSLFEVLETVKDAWPPPPHRDYNYRPEDQKLLEDKNVSPKMTAMKNDQKTFQFSSPLLNRRYSMPEELMRKFSVSKEKASDESETNKTMIDISSSSSAIEETARQNLPDVRIPPQKEGKEEEEEVIDTERQLSFIGKTDSYQQTSDLEIETVLETQRYIQLPKRVTQSEYYSQGKRILKVNPRGKSYQDEICTCRKEKASSTTASAKEETDESGTSESISSSSPTQLPKQESSSDNLSSESDHIKCTCREMTSSKETSTDLFHSGKSTLSQTISEKSVSTQDSTVSIKSVSTRGSTVSDNSNSTTPEIHRTSAKETTTSPDYSPRTPRNNTKRRRDRYKYNLEEHRKNCPRYTETKHSMNHLSLTHRKHCPMHSESIHTEDTFNNSKSLQGVESQAEIWINDDTNQITNETEVPENDEINTEAERYRSAQAENVQKLFQTEQRNKEDNYKWAKLSNEELYLMQQLRHQKFVESQRSSIPVEPTPEPESSVCGGGSVYKETEFIDQTIMIPRYSALPRTISMLVNTSSAEASLHNSDSDNLSLADSLEDQPITHIHELYFDTKNESKPVRGDVNYVQESKVKRRQPRGRAFFVSMKDPYGEDELLEHIHKIPQPPERIKNQIFKRHLELCKKHKELHKTEPKVIPKKTEATQRKGKIKHTKPEESEATSRSKKSTGKENKDFQEETKKACKRYQKNVMRKQEVITEQQQKVEETKPKRNEDEKTTKPYSEKNEGLKEVKTNTKRKREMKDQRSRFGSKIPVLISNRSTSSSPERDIETEEKFQPVMMRPKVRIRREKETKRDFDETTDLPTVREVNSQKTPKSEVERTQIIEISQNGAETNLHKPEAVIYPSQNPINDYEKKDQLTIPPLMPAFRQTSNKPMLMPQSKRSPIIRYRQRFEVIPEEKSSSLSSTEEKNPNESISKFTDASTSPLQEDSQKKNEKIQFQSYNVEEFPNLIVAKFTNKQLKTLPHVKTNDNQKIILFSSKGQNSNSSKGRDALIAMNREDFQRLAKGWMNFYKMNDNLDASENEDVTKSSRTVQSQTETEKENKKSKENKKTERKSDRNPKVDKNPDEQTENVTQRAIPNGINDSIFGKKPPLSDGNPTDTTKPSDKCLLSEETKKEPKNSVKQSEKQEESSSDKKNPNEPEIDENIRFHSSNTILKPLKTQTITKRQSSLPELKLPTHRDRLIHKSTTSIETLPKVSQNLEDYDYDSDTDSDSTNYLEPPSPRVPPLSLGDFPSDATLSSSGSELDEPKPQVTTQPFKHFQLKKRGGTNRTKLKKENSFEIGRPGKKKNSGWSVTVAGTVELSRSAPDLEMRLSFPMNGDPPVVCQSDSGFAEDSNYSKFSESLQDLDFYTSQKGLVLGSGNVQRKWTVTVKNPKNGGDLDLSKPKLPKKNQNHLLPDLESSQNRNTKNVLKENHLEKTLKGIIERKLHAIWPKVQRIIQKEFMTDSGRLITEYREGVDKDFCLVVKGNAISLERKEKPLTMTERDVTRKYTSRTNT